MITPTGRGFDLKAALSGSVTDALCLARISLEAKRFDLRKTALLPRALFDDAIKSMLIIVNAQCLLLLRNMSIGSAPLFPTGRSTSRTPTPPPWLGVYSMASRVNVLLSRPLAFPYNPFLTQKEFRHERRRLQHVNP